MNETKDVPNKIYFAMSCDICNNAKHCMRTYNNNMKIDSDNCSFKNKRQMI